MKLTPVQLSRITTCIDCGKKPKVFFKDYGITIQCKNQKEGHLSVTLYSDVIDTSIDKWNSLNKNKPA